MALNQVVVGNPANPSAPDSVPISALAGKAGETMSAELHGKWYTQAYRGNLFHGSSLVAGVVLPISTVTGANLSTFVLYNPLGSGVNLEMVSCTLAFTAATDVATPIGLGYSASVGGSSLPPTTVTTVTPVNGLLGSGRLPQARLYTVSTVGQATTWFKLLFNLTSTNATGTGTTGPANYKYEFDGSVLIPPGVVVQTCSLSASPGTFTQEYVWVENPL